MSSQSLSTTQFASLTSLRAQTLQLFDLATSDAVLAREPMPGFRPMLWHLAHIGVFQNYWVLQRAAGQPSINPPYDVHFDPIKTPREEARRLPTRLEVEDYLSQTLQRVESFLSEADLSDGAKSNGTITAKYALDLVLEHERQHQETIAFLFQAFPYALKKAGPAPVSGTRRLPASEVLVPSSNLLIGAKPRSFAYDNELPAHLVEVPSFLIDRDLTTNAEFSEFIEADGYTQRRWWSDEGWQWKESAALTRPLYWSGPPWKERGFFAEVDLRADAAVSGISWYEADAYARFRQKRLPSEFEWEVAAGWNLAAKSKRTYPWGDEPFSAERANAEHLHWGSTPVGNFAGGDSAFGLRDAGGNLWEWTSSDFRGYPGFVAYPYPEYSQTWFDGDHRVSRGGSWFSAADLLRTSFRNFYRRSFRAAFIGVRLAHDTR